jgi:hypothetical protein
VIAGASKQADGSIVFESTAAGVKIDAQCGRYAQARERLVRVEFQDGETASLDFTQEPGVARLGNTSLPPDPQWANTPRPAMAEVRDFLAQVLSPVRDPEWVHLAANCLESVVGAETLDSILSRP